MLIYDRFPTLWDAETFAKGVEIDHGLDCFVHSDAEAARAMDPFPGELVAPVVLVERPDDDELEASLTRYAEQLGGTFAGT